VAWIVQVPPLSLLLRGSETRYDRVPLAMWSLLTPRRWFAVAEGFVGDDQRFLGQAAARILSQRVRMGTDFDSDLWFCPLQTTVQSKRNLRMPWMEAPSDDGGKK